MARFMLQASDHKGIVESLTAQFRDLMATSEQGIYLYLDDRNKACNARFAQMLGYRNPEDWAAVTSPFPEAFVQTDSQEVLIDAFQDAMQNGVAATIPVTWKSRDGRPVETDVVLVPIDHDGHRVALHFIDPAA